MRIIKTRKARKGQALVEYALIIATVALTSIVALTVFGKKTSDVLAVCAGILPAAHAVENAPIADAALFALTKDAQGNTILDVSNLCAIGGVDRWAGLLGTGGADQFLAGP
jgi:hypothetical protein